MKSKTTVVVMAATAMLFSAAGCSVSGRLAPRRPSPPKNVLFSPAWTALPTFDVARSPWPYTPTFGRITEVTDYRERIIDRQGWFGNQRDFYYRRFDSVRTGRTHR